MKNQLYFLAANNLNKSNKYLYVHMFLAKKWSGFTDLC